MKLTLFLLLAFTMSAVADAKGQRVNLQVKEADMLTVLKSLREQSGFAFVYNPNYLKDAKKVSISLKDEDIVDALRQIFIGQPFDFEIRSQVITILPRKTNVSLEATVVSGNLVDQIDEVRGRVVDSLGRPISGATIQLLASQNSPRPIKVTGTDGNGEFTLRSVPANAFIQVKFIGYKSSTLAITSDLSLIRLMHQDLDIEEVFVNKGYYQESRKLTTGSVSTVTAEVIEQQPVSNIIGALTGRVAGLEITQAGGAIGSGFNVRIRGQNSIAAGNNPLYIIDGVPFASQSLGYHGISSHLPFSDGNIAINPFQVLNPGDIEQIDVLKDADATAIYGSQGANGVILITTKKGSKGRPKIVLTSNRNHSWAPKAPEFLSTPDYLKVRRMAYELVNGVFPSNAYDVNGTWDTTRNTNWHQTLAGETAIAQQIQGSISGGSEVTTFLLSGSFNHETTVYVGNSAYKRGSFLANINHSTPNDRFRVQFNAQYSLDRNNAIGSDLYGQAFNLAPNAPRLYNEDGTLNWENNTFDNPLAILENKYTGTTKFLTSNLGLHFRLLEELSLSTQLGYQDYRMDEYKILPSTAYNPFWGIGSESSQAMSNDGFRNGWIVEPKLEWKKQWIGHKIEALVGSTFQHQERGTKVLSGFAFASNGLLYDLTAATYQNLLKNESSTYRYQAFYARLNYNLNDEYLINITGRRDGSSRFGPNNKFANFGAVGAAWIFSNNALFQDLITPLSFGKIRASYGVTGNDQIGDYQFLDTYATPANSPNYQSVQAMLPQRLFNSDFGWETNHKLEASADFGFWKDRLYLTGTWFRNRSSNQLVGMPMPATAGFPSIQYNLPAKVQNSGWELEVQGKIIENGRFSWNTSVNLTLPKNKLLDFPGLAYSTYSNTYVIGQPLSIVKLYKMTGIDQQTGLYTYDDVNEDGQLSAMTDRIYAENLASKYYGGLQNTFAFGRWQLATFVQFADKKSRNYLNYISSPGLNPMAILKHAADRIWQPGSTNAEIQKLYAHGGDPSIYMAWSRIASSDVAVADMYFIRLKNVALNYRLPMAKFGLNDINLYVQGQNLWTLSNAVGVDPESGLYSNLPALKSLNVGLNLNF